MIQALRHREQTFAGAETVLKSFGGVNAVRVSHAGGRAIAEHQHDWPTLTIHVAGACTEQLETGEVRIEGPSATLLPAGHPHADQVDRMGLETFGLVFDPSWLRLQGFNALSDRPRHWRGGQVARQAQELHRAWRSHVMDEAQLAEITGRFFAGALAPPASPHPRWLEDVLAETHDAGASTVSIAKRLNLNPAWLARAYRAAAGEGLQATFRRRRVEQALELLTTTDLSLAELALTANFCDQPHMNRCFQAVLGITPAEVRAREARRTDVPSNI